jgi:GNAT superfamily N-acetyltransferase
MKKIILTSLLIFTTLVSSENKEDYTIKIITPEEMKPLFPFVAQARITIFRDYPYLYEGNFDDEVNDLDRYAQNPQSALAVAYHQDVPAGFLCGSDFIHYSPMFENPIADTFKKEGLDPEKHYYFADVILLPEHRGKHLSPKLFATLESHAQSKGYQSTCFVTEYHHNHPLKPKNHRSLVTLWNNLGYNRSDILAYASWPTHQVDGTVKTQQHPLIFWFKKLEKKSS